MKYTYTCKKISLNDSVKLHEKKRPAGRFLLFA